MKKYLLLVEDEKLWEKFKQGTTKDINTEIIELIKQKTRSNLRSSMNVGSVTELKKKIGEAKKHDK
jgi:hypothetical protein